MSIHSLTEWTRIILHPFKVDVGNQDYDPCQGRILRCVLTDLCIGSEGTSAIEKIPVKELGYWGE